MLFFSTGLVYYHFGKEITSILLKTDVQDPLVEILFVKVSNLTSKPKEVLFFSAVFPQIFRGKFAVFL